MDVRALFLHGFLALGAGCSCRCNPGPRREWGVQDARRIFGGGAGAAVGEPRPAALQLLLRPRRLPHTQNAAVAPVPRAQGLSRRDSSADRDHATTARMRQLSELIGVSAAFIGSEIR